MALPGGRNLARRTNDAAYWTHHALLMIVGATLPKDDLAAFRVAMMVAADDDKVARALVPIRGALS